MNDAKPASDIMERCQQIVNQHLQDTIPKSIDDTKIQYKTVVLYSSLVPSIRIYLRTSTENNENLCRTFCIPIYIPLVNERDADDLLSYLHDTIECTIESLVIRLTKGILANDLTAVADNENNTHI
jgi:hypothetical protein